MDAVLLFPHPLFASNATLARGKQVLLVEDPLYFTQYAFHKQKLILHRASMRAREAFLRKTNQDVHYLGFHEAPTMAAVMQRVVALQAERVHLIDPVDDWLERRVIRDCKKAGLQLVLHVTPMFLTTPEQIEEFFDERCMFMAWASMRTAARSRQNPISPARTTFAR